MFRSFVDVSRLVSRRVIVPPRPFTKSPETPLTLNELFAEQYYAEAVDVSTALLGEFAQSGEDLARDDIEKVLGIWLVRLRASLVLKQGAQVADEAVACLSELDSPELAELEIPVVWDLRILLVPAFTKGVNNTAIEKLYQMALEARVAIAAGSKNVTSDLWHSRLRELGMYVAAALVAMKDYQTALEHLEMIYTAEYGMAPLSSTAFRAASISALIYIQLGDINAAWDWVLKLDEKSQESEVLRRLCKFADNSRELDEFTSEELIHESISILALSRLYAGDVTAAMKELEASLSVPGTPTSILYDLFVLYDLVHEDSQQYRLDAATKIAAAGTMSLPNYEIFK